MWRLVLLSESKCSDQWRVGFPPESKGLLTGSQKSHPRTTDPLFSICPPPLQQWSWGEHHWEATGIQKTFPLLPMTMAGATQGNSTGRSTDWRTHQLSSPCCRRICRYAFRRGTFHLVGCGLLHSLWSQCFCSSSGFPSTFRPYNQWPSPTEMWTSGHVALCRTWWRGSPQQCWHPPWYPLWTRGKIHAAPRNTWGSHTWSSLGWPLRLLKLTASSLKWGPENPAVFPRKPWAVQIWQKLVS